MEDLLNEVAGEIEAFSAQIGLHIMQAVMEHEVGKKVGVCGQQKAYRRDAMVLASALRTDRRHFRPLEPQYEDITILRSLSCRREELVSLIGICFSAAQLPRWGLYALIEAVDAEPARVFGSRCRQPDVIEQRRPRDRCSHVSRDQRIRRQAEPIEPFVLGLEVEVAKDDDVLLKRVRCELGLIDLVEHFGFGPSFPLGAAEDGVHRDQRKIELVCLKRSDERLANEDIGRVVPYPTRSIEIDLHSGRERAVNLHFPAFDEADFERYR